MTPADEFQAIVDGEPDPRVRKPAGKAKNHALPPGGDPDVPALVAEPVWQLLQRNETRARAFVHGAWDRMTSVTLEPKHFPPFHPPEAVAALGLATVRGIDTAGWFLSAGRRLLVKTTDASRRYRAYSYESYSRIGWAVGVTSGTIPNARVHCDQGPGDAIPLEELLARAVSEAPEAEAWIVAGRVDFSTVRGQALRRSPAVAPLNGVHDPANPDRSLFSPVEQEDGAGFIAALVVRKSDSDRKDASPSVRGVLEERFFPPGSLAGERGYLTRAHYALFSPPTSTRPTPPIDPSRPFQNIWNASAQERKDTFPAITTVRHALAGTAVRRAHLSVWAVGSLVSYAPPARTELVDVIQLDPTLIPDQKWATDATFLAEPIYERPRLLLCRPVAEAVVRVNQALRPQNLRLKIYDGYRPFSVTQRLAELMPGETRKGYLAHPALGSRHNRAAAVDCTLTDMEGQELEMPSDYLCFDVTSHRTWQGMTDEARANMETLERAMAAEGFTTIIEEWWHFDAHRWSTYPILDLPLWGEDTLQPASGNIYVQEDLPDIPEGPGREISGSPLSNSAPPPARATPAAEDNPPALPDVQDGGSSPTARMEKTAVATPPTPPSPLPTTLLVPASAAAVPAVSPDHPYLERIKRALMDKIMIFFLLALGIFFAVLAFSLFRS